MVMCRGQAWLAAISIFLPASTVPLWKSPKSEKSNSTEKSSAMPSGTWVAKRSALAAGDVMYRSMSAPYSG